MQPNVIMNKSDIKTSFGSLSLPKSTHICIGNDVANGPIGNVGLCFRRTFDFGGRFEQIKDQGWIDHPKRIPHVTIDIIISIT